MAALLEMNPSPVQSDDVDLQVKPPMRFTYPSGSRPLEGYTIKRGVGRGGFGEVYFAVSDAGKEVALKLIRRNLEVELRGVTHCLNLKHPNLVALYDIKSDEHEDRWVVMEYVSGESLEDAIDRYPEGMPVVEAMRWFEGICSAVAYLHDHGIVHRDLKPANIFADDGIVKIGDYGLSKFISCSRRSGQTESVGTVHYMAPEIANGRYGREIDAYALGIILYEMLTGRVPFEGESVGEVLMKHLTAEPDLTRVGEPYRTIVARALAKDPELRLSSVEEMLALLPNSSNNPTTNATPLPPRLPPAPPPAWAPVSTPPHTHYPSPQREPLWQALVDESHRLRLWWRDVPMPPLAKALIVFGVVSVLVFTGAGLAIPVFVAPFYLVYYIVWSVFFKGMDYEPVPSAEARHAAYERQPKPSAPRRTRYNWRLAALKERSARPLRDKASTLTGSMLGSACVAIMASAVLSPILTKGSSIDPVALGIWLASVTTLGAWGVLSISAMSDALGENSPPQRGLNLLLGGAIGAAAAGLASVLGTMLPWWSGSTIPFGEGLLHGMFHVELYRGVEASPVSGVAVPMSAAAAYFAVVFFLLRWWRSTEYVRSHRIGFWSIAMTTLVAWVGSTFVWFPQPIGLAVAGVIALATQVASPWCPPSRRAALARGGMSMEV
jgi:serine/threonine protein kinase